MDKNESSGNQFVVDLGSISLNDAQKRAINSAIQKAVAGELANLDTTTQLAIFPRLGGKGIKFPGTLYPGPIIWGIIAMPLDEQLLKNLGQNK